MSLVAINARPLNFIQVFVIPLEIITDNYHKTFTKMPQKENEYEELTR